MYQYAQDYDEALPIGSAGAIGVAWGGQVYPYVKSQQVFTCPSDTTDIGPAVAPFFVKQSYGYNSGVGWSTTNGRGISGRLASFTAAAKTVFLFETMNTPTGRLDQGEETSSYRSPAGNGVSGFLFAGSSTIGGLYATGQMGNRIGGVVTPAQINAGCGTACPADAGRFASRVINGRHLEGSNFLFVDGHAKWLKGNTVSTGDPAPNATAAQTGGNTYVNPTTAAGTENTAFQATFSPI
jgi:prepilin-type processing-associated H-X9-DG protein